VCWELLQILNEDEPRLSFTGCHPIIYPVELPKWLPSPIVDKMTKQFQAHLGHELEVMVQGVGRRKHHTSHESESNISVASTTRDDSTNDVEIKEYLSRS
jgi:hypothetical protein